MDGFAIRKSPIFGEIRLVVIDGKYYIVARDIAKALKSKSQVKIANTNKYDVVKHLVPTNGGKQMMNVVSLKDVQRIIIKSKMPMAEKFEEWIEKELLPFV
ncbi:TPA: Bro-N domain-containing protein [Bacillus anthracis]|nr:Bro-N domain-containing protein [Bacillus anthracis]